MFASMKGHEGCLRLLNAAGADMGQSDLVCECDRGGSGWMKFLFDMDIALRGEGKRKGCCDLCGSPDEWWVE